MARFTYTAEKTGGEVYSGTADAKDRFELYQVVRREGGRVLSVNESGGNHWWSLQYWNAKITSVPEHDKIVFARNLGAMLSAGLALSRALSVIERQTKNPRMKASVAQIASDVRRGDPLYSALGRFPHLFSKLFVAMVKAGEEAGNMPNALETIGEQMERSYALKKKVKGALLYPCIIVVAIVGIGILMMTQVVPTLAQTFEEMDADLPYSTQLVIGISNFLMENTIIALSLFVVAFLALYIGLRTPVGRRLRDLAFLKIPVIGNIVREVNAARTARTLGSLLSAGVDVISSISITEEVVQNSYFKGVLTEAALVVQKGDPLSTAFSRNEHLYPPLVGEMVAVGEETGQLADMMKKMAIFYEEEVDRKTKDMSTIIEPFLMVFIGAAVGFFAIAMISPIYQLSDSI